MAAAYLYVIVCNHPFVDGNKRVGAAAALLFLALNGIEIYADEDAFGDLVFAVAENRASKDAIAMFLRAHTVY